MRRGKGAESSTVNVTTGDRRLGRAHLGSATLRAHRRGDHVRSHRRDGGVGVNWNAPRHRPDSVPDGELPRGLPFNWVG